MQSHYDDERRCMEWLREGQDGPPSVTVSILVDAMSPLRLLGAYVAHYTSQHTSYIDPTLPDSYKIHDGEEAALEFLRLSKVRPGLVVGHKVTLSGIMP